MRIFRRQNQSQVRRDRRGATVVEFAFVAPLIFLFVFASIEFGRAFMAIHSLEGAASDGCRAAVVAGADTADVNTAVTAALQGAGISGYTVNVSSDGSPLTSSAQFGSVEQWAAITVTVSVPYSSVSWLPIPGYLPSFTLQSTATLPREAEAT